MQQMGVSEPSIDIREIDRAFSVQPRNWKKIAERLDDRTDV